jgi:nucleoid-associated protein YgaU
MSAALALLESYVATEPDRGRGNRTDRRLAGDPRAALTGSRGWRVLIMALVAAVGVLTAAQFAAGASGAVPASGFGGAAVSNPVQQGAGPGSGVASGVPVAPAGVATYVVQPGDTVWSIARALQPRGDVGRLIARISAANGGVSLEVGQKLVVAT